MERTRILWRATLAVATLSASMLLTAPASPAHATMTGFKAVQGSAGWVDFNGGGRADLCQQGGSGPNCRLALSSGFDVPRILTGADAGWVAGRAWADFNGDQRADYCRVVGGFDRKLQCTNSNATTFGSTYTSGPIDPGYDAGRAWVDVTGDGKADYCRVIESWGYKLRCTRSTGTGFGYEFTSNVLDPGYDQGRSWVDVNGDSRADFCRIVGGASKFMECTLSTGGGFGTSITSAVLDPGYDDSRRWGDVNGDGKADFCRIVGSGNYSATTLRCSPSTGTGFAQHYDSPLLDAGYGGTGAWADVDGDGKDDYCRETGNYQGVCTISTGAGFGITFSTPITGQSLVGWADFNGDGKADLCRWQSGAPRCTVSNGTSFGITYG